MPHIIELAPSGRAKCRGCSQPIAKGDIRLGERIPNPFGDGEATFWFHPQCGAFRRAEVFLEALEQSTDLPAGLNDKVSQLSADAQQGIDHHRLGRIDGAQLAPSARARCRQCREPIEKGAWRVKLAFFEDGMTASGGFVHLTCAPTYFETPDLLRRIGHFSPNLSEADINAIAAELQQISE